MGLINSFIFLGVLASAGSLAYSGSSAPKTVFIEREYAEAAKRYKVDPKLFKAVLFVESNFNHRAVNPETLDFGIGQINWKTASDYNIDTSRLINDRAYSIDRAAFVLSKVQHRKSSPESISWVCHYNVGGAELTSEARKAACARYLIKIKTAYEILGLN